jgi:integrase
MGKMTQRYERKPRHGSVLKLKSRDRNGRQRESKFYYILYYVDGRQVRENTKTADYHEAARKLQIALGEDALGLKPAADFKSLKYEALRPARFEDYAAEGRASLYTKDDGEQNISGLNHLDKFFRGMSASRIDTDKLRHFRTWRLENGAAKATVNRNLGLLRSMLKKAYKDGKIRNVPHVPMFSEESLPIRQGFVDPRVFAQLRDNLPANLRPLVTFLYYTGCRVGAARQITWEMVNADATEIVLPKEIIKNRTSLTLPLVGAGLDEVAAVLGRMKRSEGAIFDVTNLRWAWAEACAKIGVGKFDKEHRKYEGLKIHDLRRSAARNLRKAKVPEDVAMKITGHKTSAIFRRYAITDGEDVRDALVQVGQYNADSIRSAENNAKTMQFSEPKSVSR